ncbi:Exonuclease V protein [Dioscorea alata]|uniref:Exonuclease V protein n=1 Tax=Dioscorea alata TaxID=55571 RepID=A0ACB7VTL1_DIOAL|nr:Exonuclease V protein [Dioscorea alata]
MNTTPSTSTSTSTSTSNGVPIQVPLEIITEEEMAFLEAALSSALPLSPPRCSSTSSLFRVAAISSLSSSPKSQSQPLRSPDIEDSTPPAPFGSLLHRFRSRRALAVTDITGSEWCEKQVEFGLLHGRPKRTAAMEAGSIRHAELEEEVVEKVEIQIKSIEESWALKFMNFMVGANQLLFEGLTRELPVIGVVEDTWMIGVIDELQMPVGKSSHNPCLVDTKTRCRATLPSEAQKRNARLQLMCYKYLWDNLVVNDFSTGLFFDHFALNPQYVLSEDIRQHSSSLGFEAKVNYSFFGSSYF